MINFVDITLIAYLQALFPGNPVVIAPPENALSMILNANAQLPGLPGFAVWRNAPKLTQLKNTVRASDGMVFGRNTDGSLSLNVVQNIDINVPYVITAWTGNNIVDRDQIERKLAFFDIYNTLQPVIAGNTFSFPFQGGDTVYAHQNTKDNKLVEYYSLTKNFTVRTFWAKSGSVPSIQSIQIVLQKLSMGEQPLVIDTIEIALTGAPNDASQVLYNPGS